MLVIRVSGSNIKPETMMRANASKLKFETMSKILR